MNFTHYSALAAARIVHGVQPCISAEMERALKTYKQAEASGYRFNAYGECISHTPEQCAHAIAADQVWDALFNYRQTPDFLAGRPY